MRTHKTAILLFAFLAWIPGSTLLAYSDYSGTGTSSSPADNTPVNNTRYPIQAWFTPSDDIGTKVGAMIDKAEESVWIASPNIDLPELSLAVVGAKGRKLDIRIILDNGSKGSGQGDGPLFSNNGIPVFYSPGAMQAGLMHYSFVIIDSKTLILGSFQWDQEDEAQNYENVVKISDPDTVKTYTNAFLKLWQQQ